MNDNSLQRRAPEAVPITVHEPQPVSQPWPSQAHQHSPSPQPAPQPAPYPAPQPPTDGLAIAAFVCGLFGLALIPIVLGHLSLKRIRRGERSGVGFAVVGLILGYAALTLWIVVGIAVAGSVIWAVNS